MVSRAGLVFVGRDVCLAFASPTLAKAPAQQPPPPPRDQDISNDSGEAIVITAKKRAEALLKIPQSVSVVGGDTLERQQATNIQDFANLVPGLSLTETNPGNTRIVLRGINTGGVGATVGVYVDETPFGSSSGLVNGVDPCWRLRYVRRQLGWKSSADRRARSMAQARSAASLNM